MSIHVHAISLITSSNKDMSMHTTSKHAHSVMCGTSRHF